MYNGIGLQTARGSGTNGYVQSNKFFIKPKPSSVSLPPPSASIADPGAKKANKEILEHDRKRRIELRLIVLEETLIDQGYTQSEIAEKLRETRAALEAAPPDNPPEKRISDTQTHQIAARKEKQLETFRAALGIKLGDESPKHDTEEQKHHDKAQGLETEESGGEKDREQRKFTDDRQDHGDRERESSKKARATEEHSSKNDLNDKKNRDNKMNEVEQKKMDAKKGRYKDVSASDSSGEDVKNGKMKPSGNTQGLDSRYTDIRSSKKSSKFSEKDKISSYLDSDEDSDSSSESGGEKTRKSRKIEKQRKYDSDSGTDGDDRRKRRHVKERPRGRGYDHDESDPGHDSGRENTRKSSKYVKQQRRYDNESKINEDIKKKKGHANELPSRRRHDSDESDSDSDSGMEDTRKSRKFVKKQMRYDSSSETDEDGGRKKARVNETSRKRRHDSDDSDSASDDSESDRGRKSKRFNDKRNRNDSEAVHEKKGTKNKKILEKSRRHDSEDSSSGANDSESHSSDSTSDASDSSSYKRMDAKIGRRLKSIVEKDLSSGISRKDDQKTSQISNEHRNRDHSSLLKKSEKNRPVEMRNDRKEVRDNENQDVQRKRRTDEGRDDLPVLESRGSGLGKSEKMKESLEAKKDRENRDHRTGHERRDNQKRDDYKYRTNSQKHYDEDNYDRRHKNRDDRSRDDRGYNDSKRRKFESSRQYARSDRYDSDSGEDSKSYRRR